MLGDHRKVFILDGDVIRTGLNKDLGFSAEDRAENIRRISEVSKLFNLAGQIVFVAFISPYGKDRDYAKKIHNDHHLPFYECFINSSLEVCEERDVKGLYKKARAGEIKNFTGISDPYEAPTNPELEIRTDINSIAECSNQVIRKLQADGIITGGSGLEHVVPEALFKEGQSGLDTLPSIDIDREHLEYLQTISESWAYPLNKFMTEMEVLEVMQMKTITDPISKKKHLFSVPITCAVTNEQKAALEKEARVAIKCSAVSSDVYAVIEKPVFFTNRKEEICARTYGTFSLKHPKIERVMAEGDWCITGESMTFTKRVTFNDGLDQYRMTPVEINNKMKELNADAVYAFQVRNPLHNGHVLLLKDTREQLLKKGYKNPILLLHPLGGWTKDDDVPTDTRMLQHQALLDEGTLTQAHTILAIWPSPMYYAGPTEVMWHASSRANCGITHFITGRDPAGMKHPEEDKDLYDVWHGQKLLVHVKEMIGGAEILPFKVAAYNKKTQAMEFFDQAANKEDFDFISGSRMRAMAKAGETPPPGFMGPKGWEVLAAYYKALA